MDSILHGADNYMKHLIVLTNLIYPIVGYFGNEVTFIGGIVLGLASGIMHYNRTTLTTQGDWFGMYFFTFTCYYYLFPSIATAVAFTLFAMIAGIFIERLVDNLEAVGLTVLILVALKSFTNPVAALVSLVMFMCAYASKLIGNDNDLSHSVWHLFSGLGYRALLW